MNNMATSDCVGGDGYVAGSAVVGMHGSPQPGQRAVCIEQTVFRVVETRGTHDRAEASVIGQEEPDGLRWAWMRVVWHTEGLSRVVLRGDVGRSQSAMADCSHPCTTWHFG